MKEIEVLVKCDDDKDTILNILSKFEFLNQKELHDIYYEDKLRDNLKPEKNLRINEIFRIRRIGKGCLVTYKVNHFDGKRWRYINMLKKWK